MTCKFCGKTREQHLTHRPATAPRPRVACLGLRENYMERPLACPELRPEKTKLHHVKMWICEHCLQGVGRECHTPCCALYLHTPPGHPITPELYEILQTVED
jgi:hypothetical protein